MAIVFPVLASGLAVFVIALVSALAFGSIMLRAFIPMLEALRKLNSEIARLGDADMGNMNSLDMLIRKHISGDIPASWEHFQSDAHSVYNGNSVPDPTGYFKPGKAAAAVKARTFSKIMPYIFGLLCLCAVTFPAITSILIEDAVPFEHLAILGFLGALLVFGLFLSVRVPYVMKNESYLNESEAFVDLIKAKTVVAQSPSTADAVLRSHHETRDAFYNAANHITSHLGGITKSVIIPAVTEAYRESLAQATVLNQKSLEQINRAFSMQKNFDEAGKQVYAQLQHSAEQYGKFSASISNKLAQLDAAVGKNQSSLLHAVEAIKADGANNLKAMQSLDSAMKNIYHGISKLDDSLRKSVGEMTVRNREMLDGNRDTMNKMLGVSANALEQLTPALHTMDKVMKERVEDMRKASEDHARLIAENVANVGKGLGKVLDQYGNKMASDISQAMESNNKVSADLAQAARLQSEVGAEQYRKVTEYAAALISGMAKEMRSAMGAVGTDIASSIANAYKSNAEIVDQLAVRTAQLVAEYDNYFNGIDKSTTGIINSMDTSITNTLLRLTEELSEVMNAFKTNMHEGMERFESGTSRMIVTFEEQSRDLGLYARELNVDINTLTENLRDSVNVFNEGLNAGVQNTFKEFDEGLAMFTTRFANTLETVRDSVEALPAALRGGR